MFMSLTRARSRTQAEEVSTPVDQFRLIVDAMPINVIVADAESLVITYMNAMSLKTLRTIEHLLPVKADAVVGQSIDVFHQNPAHQRAILANPVNFPHKAIISLGDEKLELVVSTVAGESGEITQFLVTWAVVTEVVADKEAMDRLKQMVDNMPVNVMSVDVDTLAINYINHASVETLRSIEHLLPVKADEMMGQCIDIFHKNPSHQRRILANPDNLPHSAKIKLGDETLDLLVAAIHDTAGNYDGAMLTWTVITDRVTFAHEVESVTTTVAAAAAEMEATCRELRDATETGNEMANAVAAAMTQMTASIEEIARQVTRTSGISTDAVAAASQADVMFRNLEEAGKKIDSVVELITNIAGQTNLLALNATIEAASAGDAGKGFAVVASEVKNLANQTAQATQKIGDQITEIQTATQEGVQTITGIARTVGELNDIATVIAAAMEEQSSTTQEVAKNVSDVSAAAMQTESACERLFEAAALLATDSDELQRKVQLFVK